jgi:predicted nucleic acid-binding protein
VLLDTTFISDLIRETDAAVEKRDELKDSATPIALSALTVFEAGMGLRGVSNDAREQFDRTVGQLDVAPFGEREARRAVAIQTELIDSGERIGSVDVLIAATAAESTDPTVLTRNVNEFERVEGIDVETY